MADREDRLASGKEAALCAAFDTIVRRLDAVEADNVALRAEVADLRDELEQQPGTTIILKRPGMDTVYAKKMYPGVAQHFVYARGFFSLDIDKYLALLEGEGRGTLVAEWGEDITAAAINAEKAALANSPKAIGRNLINTEADVGPCCMDLGILDNVHRLFRMAALEVLASRFLASYVRAVVRLTSNGIIINERFGVEPEVLLRSLVETADHLGLTVYSPTLYCFGPREVETDLIINLALFERSGLEAAMIWSAIDSHAKAKLRDDAARGFYDNFIDPPKIRYWERLQRDGFRETH